jgi:hypothetical protein
VPVWAPDERTAQVCAQIAAEIVAAQLPDLEETL